MAVLKWLVFLAWLATASAQTVSAPTNYWPVNYGGSAFRGKLTEVSNNGMTFKLTYQGKKKSEEFIGTLEAPCGIRKRADGANRITASNIPMGTEVTAYYQSATVKFDGKNVKVYKVIALTIHGVEKKLDKGDLSIIGCVPDGTMLQFKAFGGESE